MDLPLPRLPGRHQFANAAAAIAAVKAAGFELSRARRRKGDDHGRLAGPHAAPAAGQAGRAGAGRAPRSGSTAATIRAPAWSSPRRWPSRKRRYPRPLFLICRHDQHQGPDRLFPRLQGHGAPCLHGAGEHAATPACPTTNWRSAPPRPGLSAEPVSSVANALMLLRDTWDALGTAAAHPDRRLALSGRRGAGRKRHAAGLSSVSPELRYFSSISMKAYSPSLALMTSCSTPSLRK